MLSSVPTNTVNTNALKVINVSQSSALNLGMFGIEVGHTKIAVSNLPAVCPVNIVVITVKTGIMPILRTYKALIYFAVITGKMVSNNVNDNLNSVLMCFCTK